MGSNVITHEDVMESLMNDGTIDAIRLKIINQLKANEELKNFTITMLEQSKVLNTPGVEKQTKRELFDALRQELETPALERASKSVWDLILDKDGLGKEINDTVESVFCRLSGSKPPLFPPSNSEIEQDKATGKESLEKEKESKNLKSSSKKRKLRKKSVQVEEGEVAEGSGDPPSIPEDFVPGCKTVSSDCGNSMEQPGRCKRTDGKNWRCSKDCVPNNKYCERHMNRGRSRPRKETTTQTTLSVNMVESSPTISTSTPTA